MALETSKKEIDSRKKHVSARAHANYKPKKGGATGKESTITGPEAPHRRTLKQHAGAPNNPLKPKLAWNNRGVSGHQFRKQKAMRYKPTRENRGLKK